MEILAADSYFDFSLVHWNLTVRALARVPPLAAVLRKLQAAVARIPLPLSPQVKLQGVAQELGVVEAGRLRNGGVQVVVLPALRQPVVLTWIAWSVSSMMRRYRVFHGSFFCVALMVLLLQQRDARAFSPRLPRESC